MARIYAFANQKGGVGKTTTAVNLSAYLAAAGKRVLLVDADPQANATSSLGIDGSILPYCLYDPIIGRKPLAEVIISTAHANLELAPSAPALAGAEVELVSMFAREHQLRKMLEPVIARFDHILLDCPPSLGLLTVNALTAARDGVIVPIQCEYLALEGLGRLWQTIQLVREHLNPRVSISGMVLTMFDPRTNLSTQVVNEVRKHFPEQTFRTIIPRNVRLSEAPSYGQTILAYAPTSAGAAAYAALAQELLAREEAK
jgi:chromosome partitioning protein